VPLKRFINYVFRKRGIYPHLDSYTETRKGVTNRQITGNIVTIFADGTVYGNVSRE